MGNGRCPVRVSPDELCHEKLPNYECHVHTPFSKGNCSIETIIKKAVDNKVEKLVFTEHTEQWMMTEKGWYGEYWREVSRLKKQYEHKIEIYIGIEANIVGFSGELELTNEMFETAEFILGAAHRYPGLDGVRVRDLSPSAAVDLEFRALIGLAGNKNVDAIAHIGGTCEKYICDFPFEMTEEIIKRAADNDVAIEINAVYHKNKMADLIDSCKKFGALTTLGSNAYCASSISEAYNILKTFLKKKPQ